MEKGDERLLTEENVDLGDGRSPRCCKHWAAKVIEITKTNACRRLVAIGP
jgi:hypothetical protein